MAVLVYSEISSRFLDALQANVAADSPFADATQLARILNDGYATVYESEGGGIKSVASSVAWTAAERATGTAYGILTDIREITHVWATTTAPVVVTNVTTTNASTTITSAAGFGAIVRGMYVTGTGMAAGTLVADVTSSSTIVLTVAATAGGTVTLTFSPTVGAVELDRAELSEIQYLRRSNITGTYDTPKLYAATRMSTAVPAAVGFHRLDYYPAVTSTYFPIEYVPQFTPIDASVVTTPDVTDVGSWDIAYVAAYQWASKAGRTEFLPTIAAMISERTSQFMARKQQTLLAGNVDL